MTRQVDRLREDFLHWIWSSLHINVQKLRTLSGEKITLLDPGTLNISDGPDFKDARLDIGRLRWHGDIEMHWYASDWNRHGHHADPNYNKVVLHVVYHRSNDIAVFRMDRTSPYTLHLKPYLPENLSNLVDSFKVKNRLPCFGHIPLLSDDVFEEQFTKADREYFEAKIDHQMSFFNSTLPPGTAWKYMFIYGLFDGLGIALNRQPMLRLAGYLLGANKEWTSLDSLHQTALKIAGFDQHKTGNIKWNYKSCRPANRPELRAVQAVELMWMILNTPLAHWISGNPAEVWLRLISGVTSKPGIGESRSGILYGTVFLPGIYILGNILNAPHLQKTASSEWMTHRPRLPGNILRLFRSSGFPPEAFEKRLGAVYQLKYYCRPRRCQDCKLLQRAISP